MQIDHLDKETTDGTVRNLDALYQLFPSCFTEAPDALGKVHRAVDWGKLRSLLGEYKYDFTWVGKRAAQREAAAPCRKTLRPCPEESVYWDTTQNLYIEGDNLEVLKLLQNSYMGKVKMIYIDPPYNTGSDFVYHDDFHRTQKEEDEAAGIINESGERMIKNTSSNGKYHSDWCSMIYSRLMVARSLLSDDGIIFISIDDNEIENLKKICDEVFGEDRLAGIVHRRKNRKPHNAGNTMSLSYEFILIYYKSNSFKLAQEFAQMHSDEKGEFAIYPVIKADKKFRTYTIKSGTYCEIDKIEKGIYRAGRNANLDIEYLDSTEVLNNKTVSDVRLKARYCLTDENGKFTEAMNNDNIFINGNGFPKEKRYRTESDFKVDNHHWDIEKGKNEDGDEEIKDLFEISGVNYLFQYPKPVALLKKVLSTISSKDFIALDFFSGSATTAHAIMQLNSVDGGTRKFIMLQLPEETEKEGEAYKKGYKNICEIGKERIRRAGKKIKEEHPESKDLDIGFRVLKCDESNYKPVAFAPKDYTQESLDMFLDNIKEERTGLDLLFDCMMRWGLELSLPYETQKVDGCTIYNVDEGSLVACFDGVVTGAVIDAIAETHPLRVVFRDSSFTEAAQKMNLFELFKQKCGWTDQEVQNNVRVI